LLNARLDNRNISQQNARKECAVTAKTKGKSLSSEQTESMSLQWSDLARRVEKREAVLRAMKSDGADCKVKLDRLQFECSEDPSGALRELPGFEPGRSVFPRRHHNDREVAYGHAQWFKHSSSGTKFNIEGNPQRPFLSPWRVTVVGDDFSGLPKQRTMEILAVIPGFKLTLLEIAFDFGIQFAQRKALRRSVLFGKSRFARIFRDTLYWGTARGMKLVRMYWKSEIGRYRIELELHSRFLRHYGIEDISDFSKLATLLPRKHIWFTQLNTAKLYAHLLRKGNDEVEMRRIGHELASFNTNAFTLSYGLQFEIQNVRRVLSSSWLNRVVREALVVWAQQWPTKKRQNSRER
jgi:hypothetical protein